MVKHLYMICMLCVEKISLNRRLNNLPFLDSIGIDNTNKTLQPKLKSFLKYIIFVPEISFEYKCKKSRNLFPLKYISSKR